MTTTYERLVAERGEEAAKAHMQAIGRKGGRPTRIEASARAWAEYRARFERNSTKGGRRQKHNRRQERTRG